jgi:hypothetical protein
VAFAANEDAIVLFALVRAGDPHFAPADANNPFDNEQSDTLAAGLQLYLRTPDTVGAWMIVPESGGESVRVRPISGWEGSWTRPAGRWRSVDGGYELRVELRLPEGVVGDEYPVDVDVIVNETTVERTRRRGQLVMSGARGEFVYLRGDRHDAARLMPLVIVS